jgi:hypothetical protein
MSSVCWINARTDAHTVLSTHAGAVFRSLPIAFMCAVAGGDEWSAVYRGPVLRDPAELLPAVDRGGRVRLGGRSCKGWRGAPAFGG